MESSLPVIAGMISTLLFMVAAMPMLLKAFRTQDMSSYSLGHIVLTNAGNLIHAVYVFSMPPGPLWMMHTFWLVSTALMLTWYLRYEWLPKRSRCREAGSPHGATT